MDSRNQFTKRARSIGLDDKSYMSISHMRDINKAIHSRNPSALLNDKISRMSVSPTGMTTDSFGNNFQMLTLRKTINKHKLMAENGHQNKLKLHSELKLLDIENKKREFWNKQNLIEVKRIKDKLEETLDNQMKEEINRVYYKQKIIAGENSRRNKNKQTSFKNKGQAGKRYP